MTMNTLMTMMNLMTLINLMNLVRDSFLLSCLLLDHAGNWHMLRVVGWVEGGGKG